MNISAVICRKKRKSSTGRSKRSGLPDAVNPDRASMSLCNGRFVAAACQHMTRAIRGADFEERAMQRAAAMRWSLPPGIFSLPLIEVLFIKPEELFKSFEREQRLDTIKT